MRKILLGLMMLVMVACRSVPGELVETNNRGRTESAAAFVVAEDLLQKIEARSADLNDTSVTAAATEWNTHFTAVLEARRFIKSYLEANKDTDVSSAYDVGTQLLGDMNGGV